MGASSYASSLIKAFDVLDCFFDDSQEIGIKDIALQIGMPQSSVYRIIQSLELRGLIYQNQETKKYRLGPKFAIYSEKTHVMAQYIGIAARYMQQLGNETGETVNLGILDFDKIIYTHRVESRHVLRPNFTLKAAYPAYKTGLGMVLMSELSPAVLQWIYENNHEDIGCSFDEFCAKIEQVRKDGVAYDDQVFCEGLRCVAAPVRGPGGNMLFSISISAPTLRFDNETYHRAKLLLQKSVASITQDIQNL